MKPYGDGITFESVDEVRVALRAAEDVGETLRAGQDEHPDYAPHVDAFERIATALGGIVEIEEISSSEDPTTQTNTLPELSVAEYLLMALRLTRDIHPDEDLRAAAKTMLDRYNAAMFADIVEAEGDEPFDPRLN